MRGSFHVATISGIPLKIHWTFGFLLIYVAWTNSVNGFNPGLILFSILNVLSLVVCVILHEFGHALTARRFGVDTRDIIMTPIGGIARLERMPDGRGQEFWVAIAGPAVNFAIALLIALGYIIASGNQLFTSGFWLDEEGQLAYFKLLLLTNLFLGLFNLIPAFPMDGGRILRSLLSLYMSRSKATRIASVAGQAIAVLMFIMGLYFGRYILAMIGVFIFYTARQENLMQQKTEKLSHLKALHVLDPIHHLLYIGMKISMARENIRQSENENFTVWSGPGIPAGFIAKDDLLQLPNGEYDTLKKEMLSEPTFISQETPVSKLLGYMQKNKIPMVLIVDDQRLIGEVHYDNVLRRENL